MKKHRSSKPPIKIVIDVPIGHASGRDVLMGVFHQIEMVKDWDIRLYQHEWNPLTAEMVRHSADLGIGGIIVSKVPDETFMESLSRSDLPVVTIGFGAERFSVPPKRHSAIRNDADGIGRMGAEYFLSLGQFRSFGFLGLDWSNDREQSFRRIIEANGRMFDSLTVSQQTDGQIDRMADWLVRLPKPAAVMLACDRIGLQTISACEKAGLRIPSQVSLLGIDNDELICEHTTPTLSSVLPGHEEMGRAAVVEMNRLISSNGRYRGRTVVVHPLKVVERSSTVFLPPATMLVNRAKAFIAANACKGATVKDVTAHLKVSARLAELRYRDLEGITIREALEAVRLAKVKRLLANTNHRIGDIASTCGFRTQSHLAHVFVKRFGMSMRDFRRSSIGTKKACPRQCTTSAAHP